MSCILDEAFTRSLSSNTVKDTSFSWCSLGEYPSAYCSFDNSVFQKEEDYWILSSSCPLSCSLLSTPGLTRYDYRKYRLIFVIFLALFLSLLLFNSSISSFFASSPSWHCISVIYRWHHQLVFQSPAPTSLDLGAACSTCRFLASSQTLFLASTCFLNGLCYKCRLGMNDASIRGVIEACKQHEQCIA
jgi:hypothetical protein